MTCCRREADPNASRQSRRVADRTTHCRALVGLFVVPVAVATSLASFLVLTGQTAIEPTPIVVRTAGSINGLVVLLLIGIVAYEAAGLWIARRRGRAAARLHVRIVLLFSFIAALPAILMAVDRLDHAEQGPRPLVRRSAPRRSSTRRARSRRPMCRSTAACLALDLLAIAGEFNRVTPDIDANCRGHRRLPHQPGRSCAGFRRSSSSAATGA